MESRDDKRQKAQAQIKQTKKMRKKQTARSSKAKMDKRE